MTTTFFMLCGVAALSRGLVYAIDVLEGRRTL